MHCLGCDNERYYDHDSDTVKDCPGVSEQRVLQVIRNLLNWFEPDCLGLDCDKGWHVERYRDYVEACRLVGVEPEVAEDYAD